MFKTKANGLPQSIPLPGAAQRDFAHDEALITVKANALFGLDVTLNDKLATSVKDEFKEVRKMLPALETLTLLVPKDMVALYS